MHFAAIGTLATALAITLFASTASAQSPTPTATPLGCQGILEVNTLRAGSPTIRISDSTGPGTASAARAVTARARITKGSAFDGTLCPGTIAITNDETVQVGVIPATFEVGKGGQGGTVSFFVPDTICSDNGGDGDITFSAVAEAMGAVSSAPTPLIKSVVCR
jgi:hypothetical protein